MLYNIIQIAGVADLDEALMLINQGVEYIGFPLRLKDGREDIPEEDARQIIKSIKPKSNPVLITYLQSAKGISEFCKYLGVDIVQLHGEIESQQVETLKQLSPNLQIIKSLIIKEDNLKELEIQVNQYSLLVDVFITDTFDPSTGRTGATGRTHNWNVSREIVKISPKPVILAGGLNPENVRDAINKVRPSGVDSHTGVEGAYGRKDAVLVKKFISEAQKGFSEIASEVD